MYKLSKKTQLRPLRALSMTEDIYDFDANDKALAKKKKKKAPVRIRLSILEAAKANVYPKPTIVVSRCIDNPMLTLASTLETALPQQN